MIAMEMIVPNGNSQLAYQQLNILIEFVKNKQLNTKERQNARNNFLEQCKKLFGFSKHVI